MMGWGNGKAEKGQNTMPPTIRLATPQDAPPIAANNTPFVQNTAISFELEPPSLTEIENRIHTLGQRVPRVVCVNDELLVGYAYASSHRTRAAYQWAVDVSVYVHPQARRRRVGQALYTSLLRILELQGFFNAYAGIALPNPASVGLHESLGFKPVGVYRQVGYKLGAWHDVGWWELMLRSRREAPEVALDMTAVQTRLEWEAALTAGLSLLRF
jgi:phosphinothricin acetyltransferase